jgi:hypothetical protein
MPWTRRDIRLDRKPHSLGVFRAQGVKRILVFCANAPACRHQATIDAAAWSDDTTLGELQRRMQCTACDHRGADVRPCWDNWKSDGPRWAGG